MFNLKSTLILPNTLLLRQILLSWVPKVNRGTDVVVNVVVNVVASVVTNEEKVLASLKQVGRLTAKVPAQNALSITDPVKTATGKL